MRRSHGSKYAAPGGGPTKLSFISTAARAELRPPRQARFRLRRRDVALAPSRLYEQETASRALEEIGFRYSAINAWVQDVDCELFHYFARS
jgi:hypothetical protein